MDGIYDCGEGDDYNEDGKNDLMVESNEFLEDEIEIVPPDCFDLDLCKESCVYGEVTIITKLGTMIRSNRLASETGM